MNLSLRLKALQQYSDDAAIEIWDIGCDHGLLGLSFVYQPNVQHIHLVDPSALVVDSLFKKDLDSYITREDLKVTIHHSLGQAIKLTSSIHSIFIAGMGGQEIKSIVENLIPQMTFKDRLIISPHRNILELRTYLSHSKLRLITEQVVFEDGQFYQILVLSLVEDYPKVHAYGDLIWNTETGESYRKHQIHHFKTHRSGQSEAYVLYLISLYSRN